MAAKLGMLLLKLGTWLQQFAQSHLSLGEQVEMNCGEIEPGDRDDARKEPFQDFRLNLSEHSCIASLRTREITHDFECLS